MTQQLISLQDKSLSNALFGGEARYIISKNFKLTGSNVVKTTNKTAQPTYTIEDGAGLTKYIKAYNRKKVEAQYSAFTNPTVTVDLLFKHDEKDIVTRTINGVVTPLLSITDFLHLVMTPKTYYIKEDSLIAQLSVGDNPYYSAYGIPVVITTWNMTVSPGTNDVVISLTMNETIDEFV